MPKTAEREQIVQASKNAGFTLIEIMAVVLIIGLLSTIVGVSIFAQVDKGRITATSVQIANLESVLELYRMDNAHYPTTEQGLEALVNEPDDARSYPPGGYLHPAAGEPPGRRSVSAGPGKRPARQRGPVAPQSRADDLGRLSGRRPGAIPAPLGGARVQERVSGLA